MHAVALIERISRHAEEANAEGAGRTVGRTGCALISVDSLVADSCVEVASLSESVRTVTPAESYGRVAEQEVAKRAGSTT